jgi:TM2 domain-containing membrane protein YozV
MTLLNSVYCRDCGKEISANALACPHCGAQQKVSVGPAKSRLTAALLAILLGGLGIHKFYLNKPIQGILYIVFCMTFIPAIIGFIEGIIYLCESDEKFAELNKVSVI